MIERVSTVLQRVFTDTLVISKDVDSFVFMESPLLRVKRDLAELYHPLNGLESALTYAKTDKCFLCGCDMPFLEPDLIEFLCSESRQADIVVPVWDTRMQPLCAVYSKECLSAIAELKEKGDFNQGIVALFDRVKTKMIPEAELFQRGTEGHSFLDVDTPEDFRKARGLMADATDGKKVKAGDSC